MDICRICLNTDCDEPIIHRCGCKSGGCHDKCLEKWIKVKGNTTCEVCKQKYKDINLNYKYKDDIKVFQKIIPVFSSSYVIFFTLGYFLMHEDCNNISKINNLNSLKFLYFIYFLNIINSNEFKLNLLEIENVRFCT